MSVAVAEIGQATEWVEIRVSGTVQGVGFRPNVWRIAHDMSMTGTVRNQGGGVLIEILGSPDNLADFVKRIKSEIPPLAKIDSVDITPIEASGTHDRFEIIDSADGKTHTQVTPDAAVCDACRDEVFSPFENRYRYPFANCTHCGPRFSILQSVPYDRSATTMARFEMCADCAAEYKDPADRRFHAQPIACYKCGPKAWVERLDGAAMSFDQHSMLDDVDAIGGLLQKGEIVAIRGIGGFHLACDATNEETVKRLRNRKKRFGKPFALMARDIDVIKKYCSVSEVEQGLLESPEAPIVLLNANGEESFPEAVAPGMNTLGFMLPYMPMHHLIFKRMQRPIIMTSGNLSSEPQVTSNEKAREKLGSIADYVLYHDRDIANRIDDSVVRVMAGAPRLIRRSRGFAPGAIALPRGFESASGILAYGGELKSTFCIVKDGAAILSQHQGDLADAATLDDFRKNLGLYQELYDFRPSVLAADLHPEYLSTKMAREISEQGEVPVIEVQHHHAHIASCMAENGVPMDAEPILGVALDGLGLGDDGNIWGGEFMLADYRSFERLGTFKPVAMLGGEQAIYEPWRNTYAHLISELGWPQIAMNFSHLELFKFLDAKPRETLDQMLAKEINAPLASSCGRLFDAFSAAIGICRDKALYEGQGAMMLEALVDEATLHNEDEQLAYPFAIPKLGGAGLPYIEPIALWQAVLGDLHIGTPIGIMAARFHKGLAKIISTMVIKLVSDQAKSGREIKTVALSGGCFQNRILLEQLIMRLDDCDLKIITHARVPANDGGLSLGQAAIAAARHKYGQNGSGGV